MSEYLTVTADMGDHTLTHRLPIREYSSPGVWVRCRECGDIHHATVEDPS